MTLRELFDELMRWGAAFETMRPGDRTCDTCKSGSLDEAIRGVAASMFATPEVVRACAEAGINCLIVHEPTYYNHWDDHIPFAIGEEKKKLIEECGVTIFRFHDHAHAMSPDLIYDGELRQLGLAGRREDQRGFGINRFVLDKPITARALAKRIEDRLGIRHVRVAGCADKPGRVLSCSFGTPGHLAEELAACDFVLTGEICEWADGQLARDYAQLGYNKAILVMGHIGSERDGMRRLVALLNEKYPGLGARYIECGEVYQYTDD